MIYRKYFHLSKVSDIISLEEPSLANNANFTERSREHLHVHSNKMQYEYQKERIHESIL